MKIINQLSKVKKRHILVTIGLLLMIIGNIYLALYYFDAQVEQKVNLVVLTLSSIISVFTIVCIIALLRWKKWGFWGFLVASLATVVLNTVVHIVTFLSGWSLILIFWAILQIKKDGIRCWDNLE
jgi:membrane-associated HD superfamily phosphohydrolase